MNRVDLPTLGKPTIPASMSVISRGGDGRAEEILRFRVASETCQFCGYDLRGLPSGLCPECGKSRTAETLTLAERRFSARAIAIGAGLIPLILYAVVIAAATGGWERLGRELIAAPAFLIASTCITSIVRHRLLIQYNVKGPREGLVDHVGWLIITGFCWCLPYIALTILIETFLPTNGGNC